MSHPLKPPLLRCQWQVRVVPGALTDQLQIGIPTSLSSVNVLEKLTELTETFCLLEHQFIIKGNNSGTARGKRCPGRGVGEGLCAVCTHHSLRVGVHTLTSPGALQTLFFWIFMEASLQGHD